MNEFRNLKRVVIREEYVAITGNYICALILNQFIYWLKRKNDYCQFLSEENTRRVNNGLDQIPMEYGWIYKAARELSNELMLNVSASTIGRYMKKLISLKFLETRKNPIYKYDQTLQYRVNLLEVEKALSKKGYILEGFKRVEKQLNDPDFIIENGVSKSHSRKSVLINGESQNDIFNITENTTETNSETTTGRLSEKFVKDLNLKYDTEEIRKTILSWSQKKDPQYIREAVAYVNSTTKAKAPKQFSAYLSQTLENGWAEGYLKSESFKEQVSNINIDSLKAIIIKDREFPVKHGAARNRNGAPVYPSGAIISLISENKATPVFR